MAGGRRLVAGCWVLGWYCRSSCALPWVSTSLWARAAVGIEGTQTCGLGGGSSGYMLGLDPGQC